MQCISYQERGRTGLRPGAIGVLAAALFMASPAVAEGNKTAPAAAKDKTLTLVVTGSLQESGFFQYIRPLFEKRHGIAVTVIAGSAGEALSRAQRGKADAVLVDDFEGEQRIVAAGHGAGRSDVMYDNLVIVGPAEDPAGISGLASVIEALKLIATAEAPFLSRGDDSGVDRAERRFWDEAGIATGDESGGWYTLTGADMRTTLGMAAVQNAYTVTDRASWLAFKARRGLGVVVEGDPRLIHQFGIITVNPKKHAGIKAEAAITFVEWLGSEAAQKAIATFTVGGEAPYTPNFGQRPSADSDANGGRKKNKRKKRR